MRVVHVVQYSLPEICSGYTLRTQAIVRHQKALGMSPVVVTSPRHPSQQPCDIDGVSHLRCEPEPPGRNVWLRDMRRVRALARLAERASADLGGADILHAHSPMLCGLAALRAARALGVPVVYEVRGLWEEAMVRGFSRRSLSPRYRLARYLDRRVCHRADAVVAISEGLRSDLRDRGVRGDRVSIVPNGVDADVFAPRTGQTDLRRELDLPGGPLVLYLGALRDYEGVDVLVRAFRTVRVRVPEAQLIIVGAGEAGNHIMSLATGFGEGIALRGPVPHEVVPDYYTAADVIVYPRESTRATELVTPLKPLEAMAMGKAIVASDVGGLREILTDGVTALLVKPGSEESLTRAVVELLQNESKRQRLGQAAREAVSSRLTWAEVTRRYVEVYESAIRARRP